MKGISVIIPTYNRELFVVEAVESVINQEYDGEVEIIISDDGSTDDTLNLLEQFNGKVKILKKSKTCFSQGVAATRNRGIAAATQPFICFLDSDDFYLPNHLKKMATELESDHNIGFVFSRILEAKQLNDLELFKPWTSKYIFKNDVLNPCVSRPGVVHTNSFIFKKEVFDKVGTFNESFSNGEDIDMWMRMSEQFKGKFVNQYGAIYRTQHGVSQLTGNSMATITECLLKVYKNAVSRYYELAIKNPIRIFELKHAILHAESQDNKFVYLFKYLNLISQYPISFLHRIPVFFSGFFERKNKNNWKELSAYIEIDKYKR